MKKHINVLLSLCLCVLSASLTSAFAITAPSEMPSYYAAANGKSGDVLWNALSGIANKGFKSLGYNGLFDAYLKTDVYPADSVGKAGLIWDMYGECAFSSSNTCGNYKNVCDCFNREHSIPKSWWGGGTGGIGNDIFHVLPTDGKVNGIRSNNEYGEVNGGTNWVGNKFGNAGTWSTDKKTIASQASEQIKGSGKVFEPKAQYKGDIARGIMGTILKWQQSNITNGNSFFSGNYTAAGYFGLTKKAVVLLMKWHREDPVSRKEIDRNNGIQQTQGNRNPFIDYPYLAEYIWGEHAGEAVDMANLIASCDAEFIPSLSNGWRTSTIPPATPILRYTISWSVNGEIIRTDSIAEAQHLTQLPATPVSCSSESNTFVGWTDEPIIGISDDAPITLYTTLTDFPAITEDMIVYATFAQAHTDNTTPSSSTNTDASASSSTNSNASASTNTDASASSSTNSNASASPSTNTDASASPSLSSNNIALLSTSSLDNNTVVYTFDDEHQIGWANTASKVNSYWLLDKSKTIQSPTLPLAGLSAIQVRMRTYGGTQYNQLAIHAGNTLITTLTATKGSTMTDYEWSNEKSNSNNSDSFSTLSGEAPLTFSCSNAAANKGIGISAITIHVSTSTTTYSRYITTCQTATELTEQFSNTPSSDTPTARKVYIGGQIYILVNGQLYTIMGQPSE